MQNIFIFSLPEIAEFLLLPPWGKAGKGVSHKVGF